MPSAPKPRVRRNRGQRAAEAPPAERPAAIASTGRGILLLGPLLVALLFYTRSLSSGFVFDDRSMITLNHYIGQWSYLWKAFLTDVFWFKDPLHAPCSGYYRPLQNVWLAVNYHLFSLAPAGWHATMIVLHLAATSLVFMVAADLTDEPSAALVAAALFGLMPAHAEAILWLSSIPHPLAATFELAALLFFMRAPHWRRKRAFALAIGFYGGALLAHESAIVFPVLIALCAFFLDARDRPDAKGSSSRDLGVRIRRAAVGAAPFATEALVYLVVRRMVLGFVLGRSGVVRYATGAQALMTLPRAIVAYLVLLAAPWTAGPAHPVSVVRSLASPTFYGPVVALTVIAAALLAIARNNPRRGIYLFCLAWIGITIAPSLNVVAYQQRFIQDRYLYFPSVGWCVMIGDLTIALSCGSVRARRIAWSAATAIAVVYSAALWNVQSYWRDETALYSRCIEMFPQLAECHGFLGLTMYGRGELPAAERELAKSISLEPAIGPDDGDSLYALGLIHAQSGRVQEAATELAQALKVTVNPAPEKYIVMAVLYDAQGQQTQSEATIREVALLPGGGPAAGVARAMIAMNHGDLATTEATLRSLARRYPDDVLVWNNLGQVLEIANKREEAVPAFHNAIKLSPGDPRLHLAIARTLHGLARDREAIDECRQALALAADYGEAQALMAEIQRNSPQR